MADKPIGGNMEKRVQELEQKLQDSQEKIAALEGEINLLNAVYSNTNSPIFLKAADFTYLFINQQFELLCGMTNEKIRGKQDYEVFPESVADLFRDQDKQVLKCRDRVEFEETVTLPVGDLTFITSKFPVFDKDGNITAVGGICTDITSLKKAEEALRESESKWRSMFDACTLGIHSYRLEPDGRLIFTGANRAADQILRIDHDQFIGKPLEDAFPAIVGTEVPERYRQACLDGTPWQIEQIDYQDEQITGAFEVIAFQTAPGMMAAMFSDITGRKQSEDRLRQSEERFRTLVNNVSFGVTLINRRMEIMAMNRHMQELMPHVDITKHPICHNIFFDPPQEECCSYCPVVKTFEDGQVHETIVEMTGGEGLKNYRLMATPVKDSDGKITNVIEVVEDITERLKMEDELQRAKKIESIGILAGGIAHDFNNLLTSIMGNISLAKRFIDPGNKAYDRLAATEKATHRAQDLTYQLLTFSRGGAPILKPVSLAQAVKESVSFALSGTNISLDLSADQNLLPVEADEGQISQVMQNIVANAIDVMPQGGKLQVSLENIHLAEQSSLPLQSGKYIKIAVRDQGPGIPQEHREKIFDPFFTTKSSGSGLGLAICYSIIKKHKGLITCDSDQNSGTCFQVYLPASGKPPQTETTKKDDIVHGRGRILVMDDNEAVLETAAEMLCHVGYQVELARDGIEAVNFYRKAMEAGQAYDAVILDLTVPGGMGGREAMEMIVEMDPDVKGIVSSGYSNDPVMKEYTLYGFAGVVKKPYKLGQLSRAVHEVTQLRGSS